MKKPYVYATISIFAWSTMPVVTKLLLNSYSNFQALWLSSAFAAFALFLSNVFSGNIKNIKSYSRKDLFLSLFFGIIGVCLYNIFLYAGMSKMTYASQANIVNYLRPIMCVVFACIVLKDKFSIRKGCAIALSFLGVAVVMGEEIIHLNKSVLFGAFFCAMGAVSYGIFTAYYKKYKFNKGVSMMLNYFATFVITSVILCFNREFFLPPLSHFAGFAWNGIVTMALTKTLWVTALDKGNTAKISNLAYITPFVSLIWANIILGDPIKKEFLVGLVLIVGGIFIQLKDNENALGGKE